VNPYVVTTYRGQNTGFSLAYGKVTSRTCFFINNKLDLGCWKVEFHSPNYYTFSLFTEDKWWHVHNVYSEPPGSYHTTNYNTLIPLIREQLKKEGEHILVGDFNLHHP
jgi:hypothetical protein